MMLNTKTIPILILTLLQVIDHDLANYSLNSVHILSGTIYTKDNVDRLHCVVKVEDLDKNSFTKSHEIWKTEVYCEKQPICELDIVIPNEALLETNQSPLGSTQLAKFVGMELYCQWFINHTHTLLWNSEFTPNGLFHMVEFTGPMMVENEGPSKVVRELSDGPETTQNQTVERIDCTDVSETLSLRTVELSLPKLRHLVLPLSVILILILTILKFHLFRDWLGKKCEIPRDTVLHPSGAINGSVETRSLVEINGRNTMEGLSKAAWTREGGRLIRRSIQKLSIDSTQSFNTTASVIFRRTSDDYQNSITTLNSSSNSSSFH